MGNAVKAASAEAKQEKAVKLRLKRPACKTMCWYGIQRDLEEIQEDIYEGHWMTGQYEALDTDLEELLDSFAVDLWGVDYKYERLPKCDRCDDRRRIVSTGPNGNPIIELCECGRYKYTYSVRHSRPLRVYFNQVDGETRAAAYYCFRDDEGGLLDPVKPEISDGIPFEDMDRKTYAVAFTSEEKARAYCDWLNSTEEWRYSST